MKEHDPSRAPIVYAFEVEGEDGQRYEVLVHEDGMAYKTPIVSEVDEDTGYVELRWAS